MFVGDIYHRVYLRVYLRVYVGRHTVHLRVYLRVYGREGGMLRRVVLSLPVNVATRRRVLSRMLFPFHCWWVNLPCVIPVSLLVDNSRPCSLFLPVSLVVDTSCSPPTFPFHCWSRMHTVTTRFTVGQLPTQGRLIPHNLIKLIFPGRTNSPNFNIRNVENCRVYGR